jgi:hypothetical protein
MDMEIGACMMQYLGLWVKFGFLQEGACVDRSKMVVRSWGVTLKFLEI